MVFSFFDMVLHVERNTLFCVFLASHSIKSGTHINVSYVLKTVLMSFLIFINSFVVIVQSVVSDYL